MKIALASAAVTVLATAAVSAFAADPVTTRIAPGAASAVNAYGGELVWSERLKQGAALFHRTATGVARLPVPLSTINIQADLGPAVAGDAVVAIYRRCTKRGCAIYEFDLRSGRERRAPRLSVPLGCTPLAPSLFKGAIAYAVEGPRCKPRIYIRSALGRTRLVSDVHVNNLGRGPGPYFSAPATDLDAASVAWSAADTYGPLFVAARTGGKPIRLATGDAGAEFEYQVRTPQVRAGFVYWSDLDTNADGDRWVEQRAVAATGKRCGALDTPGELDSTAIDAGHVYFANDGYPGGPKGVFEVAGEFSGTPAAC